MTFKAGVFFLCILADLFLGRVSHRYARFFFEVFALVCATSGIAVFAPVLSLTNYFAGGLRTIDLKYFLLCCTIFHNFFLIIGAFLPFIALFLFET